MDNKKIFDLKKINTRLHIIEGLLRAISIIDEVIQTIKQLISMWKLLLIK